MMGNFPLTVWRLQVQGQGVFQGCLSLPPLGQRWRPSAPLGFSAAPSDLPWPSLSVSPSLCPNFLFYTDTVTLDEGPPEWPHLNLIMYEDHFFPSQVTSTDKWGWARILASLAGRGGTIQPITELIHEEGPQATLATGMFIYLSDPAVLLLVISLLLSLF